MNGRVEMNLESREVLEIILKAMDMGKDFDVQIIPSSGNASGMRYKIKIGDKETAP